ncbi:hypothetical protein [Proteiniphilum saccharofermentans]|uniref:hypothetical protein n=1 Tax=Proteiniphilum saccharofermentans TaxID=1642647 RepID=UPI0028AF0A43|nr:hypothetical protein [Proteiniphilum saccharofermentans]
MDTEKYLMLPCHYAVVFWWGTADVRLTFAAFLFFFETVLSPNPDLPVPSAYMCVSANGLDSVPTCPPKIRENT